MGKPRCGVLSLNINANLNQKFLFVCFFCCCCCLLPGCCSLPRKVLPQKYPWKNILFTSSSKEEFNKLRHTVYYLTCTSMPMHLFEGILADALIHVHSKFRTRVDIFQEFGVLLARKTSPPPPSEIKTNNNKTNKQTKNNQKKDLVRPYLRT